ncbi:unnamed protein product [Vitrella brassicaformis CCMP3155]|uniref:Choline kinase N-terminal domain-containing protein n=2 Tax=Vitrella brassicaformis TaxID=1169539 RepID=A0A0G4ES34_VITBC|nr:unnamed protein product [Vitrella brassicaformis CCMP3155]|eukprot:CEM00859.1 unnamed protein product [Vitrella brassicaformis CCMP3155]
MDTFLSSHEAEAADTSRRKLFLQPLPFDASSVTTEAEEAGQGLSVEEELVISLIGEDQQHHSPHHSLPDDDISPRTRRRIRMLSKPSTIRVICILNVPGWEAIAPHHIEIEQIEAGLTNQLFRVAVGTPKPSCRRCKSSESFSAVTGTTTSPSVPRDASSPLVHQQVLFRVYGDNSKFYDSRFELDVFRALGQRNMAPKMIANFQGGRIEEWVWGRPLLVQELQCPPELAGVATQIARLHRLALGASDVCGIVRRPCLPVKLRQWMKLSLEASFPSEAQQQQLAALNLPQIASEVESFLNSDVIQQADEPPEASSLTERAMLAARAIVFCHNDCQENNIMKTSEGIRLIDFEYSDYNYAAFDIANIFTEATIDYCVTQPPCFSVTTEAYPCIKRRRLFASVYLSELLGSPILPEDISMIDPFLQQVEGFCLASNLLWGLWGVGRAFCLFGDTSCSPVALEDGRAGECLMDDPQPSDMSFDFLAYAQARFAMYLKRKEELGYSW